MRASVLRANFRVREVNRHNPARNQRGLHQLRLVEVFCSFHLSISATNQLQHGLVFGKMMTSSLSGLVIQHEETGFMDPTGSGWWGFSVIIS